MTPGERVVLAAAESFVDGTLDGSDGRLHELEAAVEALRTERAGKTPDELVEMDLTYGQVVEGDQIWSANLSKWFDVSASVRLDNGKQRVTMPKTGNVKLGRKPWHDMDAAMECRVRRGVAGQAVDLFATVLWSGASMVAAVDTAGGPTFADHDPAKDPEASESEEA